MLLGLIGQVIIDSATRVFQRMWLAISVVPQCSQTTGGMIIAEFKMLFAGEEAVGYEISGGSAVLCRYRQILH